VSALEVSKELLSLIDDVYHVSLTEENSVDSGGFILDVEAGLKSTEFKKYLNAICQL